jgi:hypothetical protein
VTSGVGCLDAGIAMKADDRGALCDTARRRQVFGFQFSVFSFQSGRGDHYLAAPKRSDKPDQPPTTEN